MLPVLGGSDANPAAPLESLTMFSMRNRPDQNDLFKGRRFEQQIIVLCVHWYLAIRCRTARLDRNGSRARPADRLYAILRWVQQYALECDKRWSRFSATSCASWEVDKTYMRICSRWSICSEELTRQARRWTSGSARDATSRK
jgi:hypothetical protein